MKKPDKCPECGSWRLAEIVYGMPAAPDEKTQKQLDEGTLRFGGCCVEPGDPSWVCSECGSSDSHYPYFAYGSNMDITQMRDRCPGSGMIGKAELVGFRFIINSRGVATVVPDDSSVVCGVLWKLSEEDEARLDSYEGVEYGTYSKENFRVISTGWETEIVKALAYVAADSVEGEPGNGYMRRIIHAAEDVGLPETYVAELTTWSRGQ
jgi:gamma-glutamylcyclotransferase (GGCT)/AIG2-like uncharacterized protein YtfP